MIALLHAYSDANLGDRLLVELTAQRLRRIGVGPEDTLIVSLDRSSFKGLGVVHSFGTAGRSLSTEVAVASVKSLADVTSTVARRQWTPLSQVLADVDAFVGVGGGYLRAGSIVEQLGVFINHVPQLMGVSRSTRPSVYLPQSIGPLRGPVGSLLRSELAGIDRLMLRDDTSIDEVALPNTTRMPDLAVLEVADDTPTPTPPSETIVIVARSLGSARPAYPAKLRVLAERLDGPVSWAVQAEGADEKSDAVFYRGLGIEPAGSTKETLESKRPSVVVSVRLHGSIMSLAAGHPTIHLSYQRKGWAAMNDLGLSEWTHDAGTFDAVAVAEQAEELRRDPSRYWDQMHEAGESLRAKSRQLDQDIASTLRVR